MFIESQEKTKKDYYKGMLATVGSLSKLFSENDKPYIAYRIAENLFCKSFDAKNLSRGDISIDASLNGTGFGIKTFLAKKGQSYEKIAEFNKAHHLINAEKDVESKVRKIASLRNARLEATKEIAGTTHLVYHCVTRSKNMISLYEEEMRLIDLDAINNVEINKTSISFEDGLEKYKFSLSKSTLYKLFDTRNIIVDIPVTILDDPYNFLEISAAAKEFESSEENYEYVILPLYSPKQGLVVPEHSGLNQWNAGGRNRNADEVYIPIPSWIHTEFESFFPKRDKTFNLHLPNGKVLTASVCQDGSKALMSNPNSDLGKWILRDILKARPSALVTYEMLENINIDSVIVQKIDEENFAIDFKSLGAFEEFEKEVRGEPVTDEENDDSEDETDEE